MDEYWEHLDSCGLDFDCDAMRLELLANGVEFEDEGDDQ